MHVPSLDVETKIQRIATQILAEHKIRRIDQQRFMHAMLSKPHLSSQDQQLIRQIFDGIQQGVLRIVDES